MWKICYAEHKETGKTYQKTKQKKASNLTVFGSFHIDLLDVAVCTHNQIDDILCLTSYFDSGEGASCWK